MDRQHLIGMLGDPEFYQRCSHFLWLRNAALRTYATYVESGKGACCGGNFQIMRPVVEAFFLNLKELHEIEPQATARIVAYMEQKKGYPVSHIVIYYRATRKQKHPHKLTIKGGARDGSQS